MKKKKKLSELKLTSFVTSFNENEENTVQGGAGGTSAKGGCLTVVTYGYWTYCCGNSGWEC